MRASLPEGTGWKTASLKRGRCAALSVFAVVITGLLAAGSVSADPDLPGPTPNLELIPAGSLVIPMDNDKQNLVAPFNLRAYGLVNELLWNEVPVKWAIAAGKTKDGIDFTAEAQRVLPTPVTAATLDFRGGPFIIHADWADFAMPKITAWGNQVAVYELTQDATIDIRHDILQKRKVGVLDDGGNAGIHTAFLDNAGFVAGTHYEVIGAASLLTVNANSCFTSVSEPHFDSTSADTETEGIRAFVSAGGNFLAECVALTTYENNTAFGLFQTTNGIVEDNLGESYLYPNADLPYSQFEGLLASVGGSVHDFILAPASSFRPNSHLHAQDTPSTDHYAATATKVNAAGLGSLVFYLGGHNYGNGDIPSMNGRRMYMNHVMTPSVRPPPCGFDFGDDPSALRRISGTVYEDVNGDADLADAVGAAGVRVRLYTDLNGDGLIDPGDPFVGEITTDSNGDYAIQVNAGTNTEYLVAVDSMTVPPSVAFNGGFDQGDVWAEQTYGDDPTTLALDVGARFGGRTGGVSDDVDPTVTAPSSNEYQHVGRADVSAGDLSGVDFGFSFNVVTNERGGDNTDDDGSSNRTIQGSLRQFLANANAISGANAMRFVPATPPDQGSWWRVAVSLDLPVVLDAETTVDGTAYELADGITPRDENSAVLGAGGVVGVDSLSLSTLGAPEFEILDVNNRNIGLDLQADDAVVRRLAIYGFGDAQNNDNEAGIRVGDVTGVLIEENVIGASAAAFTDPGETGTADNIRLVNGDGGTILNNLIGFSGGNGIGARNNVDGWTIEGNEIRGNATSNNTLNGIFLENSGSNTVRGNLVAANQGAGLDLATPTAALTLENNTFTQNGTGGAETPGIRLFGTGHLVDRNILFENFGAGVMVTSGSTQNTITRNSIYDNGTIGAASGQIGIDLLAGGDQARGNSPFVTLNDSGDGDSGGNGLLNYPILETAEIVATTLVLKGFARPGSVIELFIAEPDASGFGEGKTYLTTLTEGSAADLDATTGSYGPGLINNLSQGSDTTNRFHFEIPVPSGVFQGTRLTSTATIGGSTSEFSGNAVVEPFEIRGAVLEDPNGDADLADGVPAPNVDVSLYLDGGDGQADGGDDALVVTTTTNASGDYAFKYLGAGTYWVVVDSKDVAPSGGFNLGSNQGDVWAEQTHGPIGALCADGSGGTTERGSAGACLGGRLGGVSDDASALATAQHVTRVALSANATEVDLGFSFNVVTNERGGDNTDDDGSAARTVQGSLRQFLANANAIVDANAMRFVPATPPDQGSWWRVSVSLDLPDVLDAATTVDGTAYGLTDGTTVRDENSGVLGAGGVVGVDALSLPTLGAPEFEILDVNNRNIGLDLQADDAVVRRLAIYGFGDAQNNDGEAGIRVGDVTGVLIEENVLGASAAAFADPGQADTADNIRIVSGDDGRILNNLIGFSGGNGIGANNNADGWLVEGNEIRGNGTEQTERNGVRNQNGADTTVKGNLIVNNKGTGIDTRDGAGAHVIENNTITGNGVGDKETAGIRLYGTGSSIDRNVIFENFGAGVMVTKDSVQNLITRNSIYNNGTILSDLGTGPNNQIGIDLLDGGDDDKTGSAPFYTLNDPGDTDSDANDLFNYPILETAETTGTTLVLTGFARPGSVIELFIADPDPSGFGEGVTYLTTLTEGSGADLDATSGGYGPGPINGIAQGEDTTNRFRFEISPPPGVAVGTVLTATATDGSNNTSEFSGNVTVTAMAPTTIVKAAFESDGTPIPDGGVLPRGTLFKFMLYINNFGGAVTDVTLQDVLGVEFQYQTGSMKLGTLAGSAATWCPLGVCDESLIFNEVETNGTPLGDGDSVNPPIDADVGSFDTASTTVDIGDGNNVSNAQLDIPADSVLAVIFTVRMQ